MGSAKRRSLSLRPLRVRRCHLLQSRSDRRDRSAIALGRVVIRHLTNDTPTLVVGIAETVDVWTSVSPMGVVQLMPASDLAAELGNAVIALQS